MGGNVKLVNRVRVALFSLYFTIFVQWESFERRIQVRVRHAGAPDAGSPAL